MAVMVRKRIFFSLNHTSKWPVTNQNSPKWPFWGVKMPRPIIFFFCPLTNALLWLLIVDKMPEWNTREKEDENETWMAPRCHSCLIFILFLSSISFRHFVHKSTNHKRVLVNGQKKNYWAGHFYSSKRPFRPNFVLTAGHLGLWFKRKNSRFTTITAI